MLESGRIGDHLTEKDIQALDDYLEKEEEIHSMEDLIYLLEVSIRAKGYYSPVVVENLARLAMGNI